MERTEAVALSPSRWFLNAHRRFQKCLRSFEVIKGGDRRRDARKMERREKCAPVSVNPLPENAGGGQLPSCRKPLHLWGLVEILVLFTLWKHYCTREKMQYCIVEKEWRLHKYFRVAHLGARKLQTMASFGHLNTMQSPVKRSLLLVHFGV